MSWGGPASYPATAWKKYCCAQGVGSVKACGCWQAKGTVVGAGVGTAVAGGDGVGVAGVGDPGRMQMGPTTNGPSGSGVATVFELPPPPQLIANAAATSTAVGNTITQLRRNCIEHPAMTVHAGSVKNSPECLVEIRRICPGATHFRRLSRA